MQNDRISEASPSSCSDISNIRMNPLTLSLPRDLEHNFLAYYNLRTVKQVRFGLFIAVFFSLIYMLVDGQLFPSVKSEEEILTYCFLIPMSVTAFVLTYFPSLYHYIQPAVAGVIIFRNVGTVCLMASDPRVTDPYFSGLLMGIIFGPSVCRMRLIYAVFTSILVLVVYYLLVVAPLMVAPLSSYQMNHCVDIIVGVIFGLVTAYPLERYARRDYLQNLIIDQEREKAAAMKLALEKERISREIHDGISSEFAGILAYTENLKNELDGKSIEGGSGDIITHIDTSARRGLQELRNIMLAIDPEVKTLGYVVAYLKRYSHDLLSARGIMVEISEEIPSAEIELHPQIILALFRITQEACHNIVKHAGADNAQLAFHYKDSMLEVTVSDNGTGFTADTVTYGRGITNMSKRAEKVGGQFSITSLPEAGTFITIILPIA